MLNVECALVFFFLSPITVAAEFSNISLDPCIAGHIKGIVTDVLKSIS